MQLSTMLIYSCVIYSKYLKIIFDPVNMLAVDQVDQQNQLWQECFEAFGSHIEVMHCKDVIVEHESFKSTRLGEGSVNHAYLFSWLKNHKNHISVLREEINPQNAIEDICFMKRMVG